MARGALKSEGAGRDIRKSETRIAQLAAAGNGPIKDIPATTKAVAAELAKQIPASEKPAKSITEGFVNSLKTIDQAQDANALENVFLGRVAAFGKAVREDIQKTIDASKGDSVTAKALLQKDKDETDGRIQRAVDGKLWEGVASELGQDKFRTRIEALKVKSSELGKAISGFEKAGSMESDAPKRPRKGRGADAYVAEGVAGMIVGDSKVLRDYVDKKTKDAEDAGDDSGTIRMSGLDAAKLLQQLGWSQPTSKATQKLIDEHKF